MVYRLKKPTKPDRYARPKKVVKNPHEFKTDIPSDIVVKKFSSRTSGVGEGMNIDNDIMIIYFDAGCSPNPGKMSAGIVVCEPGKDVRPFKIDDLGHGTNNVAEWSALLWGATWARDNGIKECRFIGDSILAVNQASGRWKVNNELISQIFKQLKEISHGMNFTFHHVLRDYNLAGVYLEHGKI